MKNILIPIEFNSNEQKLIDQGIKLAEQFNSKIWLVHIAAPEPDFVPYIGGSDPNNERERRALELKKEHKILQDYSHTINNKGVNASSLLVQGPTVETLLFEVEKLHIDLIIMGNNKHSFIYKVFLESVSNEIVKKSKIPVLLVPLES
ncbi:MAG: universal stress protein [Flaviramulus sp.]|nr:universal stress protein [Flaviramulus sp.]NNC48950.1 universal stress protein [Flaviramulus sp.]